MSRRFLLPALLPVLLSVLLAGASGCRQIQDSSLRFGKDLFVTATGPINLPVAAVRDTYGFVQGEDVLPQGILFTPILFVNLVKHALVVVVHPLDAALYPFYLPLGLKPMHIYTIDRFPYTTAPYVDQFFAEPIDTLDRQVSEADERARRGDAGSKEEPPKDFFDVP